MLIIYYNYYCRRSYKKLLPLTVSCELRGGQCKTCSDRCFGATWSEYVCKKEGEICCIRGSVYAGTAYAYVRYYFCIAI